MSLSNVSSSGFHNNLLNNHITKVISNKKITNLDSTIASFHKLHAQVNWSHYDRFTRSDLTDPNKKTYVLIINDEVAGYASVKKNDSNTSDLNMIVISPAHQRKGLGMALLLHTLEKAKKIGQKITLEYRDTEKLNHYYNHTSIPYQKELNRNVGTFKDGEAKNKITYTLENTL